MASHACGVTALYVAGAPPSRLRVSAPPGSDRMTRAGKRRQRNAGSIERTLADCCTAARGRDAFAFRVAHSIRPEGAAAAGARRARARPHDGWPASRVLLCRLLAEPGALRAVAAVAAPAAAALASGVDLAGWASLPSSPAAACRNPAVPGPPLRCGPTGAARLCRRDFRFAPAAHPAIPAPVAVV